MGIEPIPAHRVKINSFVLFCTSEQLAEQLVLSASGKDCTRACLIFVDSCSQLYIFSAAGGEESLKMTSDLLQHMRCVYQARLLASASCDLEVSTVPLDLLGRLDHIRQTGTGDAAT